MSDTALLIAGLGNPGAEYARNRHNAGFMAADVIHDRYKFGAWQRRFSGHLADGTIAGRKVHLLKPQTYMNESGRSVGAALHFYKLPLSALVVIHDELDLAAAKLKVKTGGGDAGNNGLRSITAALGPDYRRVRIGVGHPGHKDLVEHYVLSDFAKSERGWVDALVAILADNVDLLVRGEDASFQNKVHLAMIAKGFGDQLEREPPINRQ